MAQVLRRLAPPGHPDLLVGTVTGDDAAVWRLDDDRALVATVDFITPLVDDARTWGRIAAVNAASDVYAMGGRPLFALNVLAWNSEALGTEVLTEVLSGAADAAAAGGWVTAGGHSIDDPEPKFGLAVIGEVHPDRMLTNAALREGDALVLSKPLGTGIVATAIKRGEAPEAAVDAAVASMVVLNADAASVAVSAGATGATDITGFGLLGHSGRMAEASRVDIEFAVPAVPVLPGVRLLAERGFVPGGTERNLEWVRERIDRIGPIRADDVAVTVLADAQTSGGLLFGLPPSRADAAVTELRAKGHQAAVVGRARRGSGRLLLRG